MKKSVYDIVTEKVLESFNKDLVPWKKPWVKGQRPFNCVTGREYNGGNYFLLNMLPFATQGYMTLKQMTANNATIKQGQEKKYVPIFFWTFLEKTDAKGKVSQIPMLRYHIVWNIEQIDGYELPEKFKTNLTNNHNPIQDAEQVIQDCMNKPQITFGQSNKACYSPSQDKIVMPELNQFHTAEQYYATLFHELGHSTGHSTRLNRSEVTNPISFGSHDYSVEELTAELTSAFICAELGLDNTIENSSAYIKSWLTVLKNDTKMFWVASGRAQKACDFILNREAKIYEKPIAKVA